MYTELTIKDKVYKLKLTTKNIIGLEKTIKCNPLSIFGNGEEVPSVTTMVNILWFSLLHFHHGIGLNEATELFDDYLEEHTMTDFLAVIIDIYKVSGIIAKGDYSKN